jgi:hypothetical protein
LAGDLTDCEFNARWLEPGAAPDAQIPAEARAIEAAIGDQPSEAPR